MSSIGIFVFIWFLFLSIIRFGMTWKLASVFYKSFRTPVHAEWPHVTVVLALRGGDESLKETLLKLLSLDYPDYLLRIVIDSEIDPARSIVEEVLQDAEFAMVEVSYLSNRRRSCSGKISGLLHGSENIPIQSECVAVVDGDAVLHSDCLKQLVAPLMQGAVFTTGNRWYTPPATLGAMTRSLWNSLAVTSMNVMDIPWGGCMAMKSEIIENSDLRNRLANAFGEDSTIATFLRKNGHKVVFVPQATILNSEDCSVSGFYNFLVRQYLTVRMNNPLWKVVFTGNLALGLSAALANIFLFINGPHWSGLVAGYSLLIVALTVEIFSGISMVRKEKKQKNSEFVEFQMKHWLMFPVVLVALNYINLIASIHAAIVKEHLWRGITYRFSKRNRTEVVSAKELSFVDTPLESDLMPTGEF